MHHQQGPTVSRSSGFTMIEMVVVLILMTIIAATVLGRAITTSDIDLSSATDKIRNQIRYAQSQAMKRSDAVWGIQSDPDSRRYWMFRATTSVTASVTEDVIIPGGDYAVGSTRITFDDLGADLNRFTLVFDRLGRPFKAQTDGFANDPVVTENNPIVTVSKGATRPITITPETGLIR
jgi:prepilin-type N-terminal cleavage/methylation domain-containing protein